MYLEFHGDYISGGRYLGFRNYSFVTLRTRLLFVTPYQDLVSKVRTACRCIHMLRRCLSNSILLVYLSLNAA